MNRRNDRQRRSARALPFVGKALADATGARAVVRRQTDRVTRDGARSKAIVRVEPASAGGPGRLVPSPGGNPLSG